MPDEDRPDETGSETRPEAEPGSRTAGEIEAPTSDGPVIDAGGGSRRPLGDRLPGGPLTPGIRLVRLVQWIATLVLVATLAYAAWRYVGTVVLGVFAYYVARPVFQRIDARVGSRTVALIVTPLAVALPVLLLVAWTVALLLGSLSRLLGIDLGDRTADLIQPYLDLTTLSVDLTTFVGAIVRDPARLADVQLGPDLSGITAAVVGTLEILFDVGLHGVVVVVIVFYLLRDDYRLAGWALDTFGSRGGVLEQYLVAVDTDLQDVYFGNVLNALLTGFLAVFAYLLLDVLAPPAVSIPEPVVLGLLVGGASLVPFVGIKLVTWPVAAYLFVRALLVSPASTWFAVVFLAVSSVVVDYVPDRLLRPFVSGRTLHAGGVMLAYVLGPLLFGWYGVFLGPLILVFVFEFARVVLPTLVDPERGDLAEVAVGDGRSADE